MFLKPSLKVGISKFWFAVPLSLKRQKLIVCFYNVLLALSQMKIHCQFVNLRNFCFIELFSLVWHSNNTELKLTNFIGHLACGSTLSLDLALHWLCVCYIFEPCFPYAVGCFVLLYPPLVQKDIEDISVHYFFSFSCNTMWWWIIGILFENNKYPNWLCQNLIKFLLFGERGFEDSNILVFSFL